MIRWSFLLSAMVLVAAGGVLPTGLVHVLGQEASTSIKFRHERRGEGTAERPVAVPSPDKRVMVRVVGERLKAGPRLFDVATEKPLGPAIELNAHRITALAVAPDNRTIATAIGNFSNDWGEVRIWNGETGKEIAKYTINDDQSRPPLGEVFRLSFSEDGKTLTIVSGPFGGK